MTCEKALERMLVADPAELAGKEPGELTRHLEECERCAAVAATLVTELEGIEREIALWADSADADAVADAVLSTGRSDASEAPPRARGQRGSIRPARRRLAARRLAWIPLAAAAAVAGLVLLRPAEPDWSAAVAGPVVVPVIAVEPPPDRTAAIMKTGNPNITIVWLYEKGET